MELRNSTISMDLLIHRPPIPFPAKFSFATLKKTNAGSPSSIKFPVHSASSLNRPLYLSSRFRISAQFGQPTNRQNYFRKKLAQLQQVSDIWDFSKSPHENVDTNSFDLKTNTSSIKIADLDENSVVISNAGEKSGDILESESTGDSVLSNNLSSEKITDLDANSVVISNAGEKSGAIFESKSTGDSVLSNNLEGWDEKYKDQEFWGKGAEPIFTVFRRYNGEVKRVVLNEDEIMRRSGVNPVLYKEGFFKGLAQVNSRILFASMFAREIEKGKVVLPGNSSVVKLISSTKMAAVSSSCTKTTTTTSGIDVLVGIILLSIILGYCAIWILIYLMPVIFGYWFIKKLFNLWSNFRQEKSEKEALRRKKEILRRKKEILTRNIENKMRGSVEIDQDSEKSDVLSVESPPLDKEEELMEKFIKGTLPVHLDDKIQEIKEMARGARELGKTQVLGEMTGGEDDQFSKEVTKGRESIQKPTLVCKASVTEFSSGFFTPSNADDWLGDHTFVNDKGGW